MAVDRDERFGEPILAFEDPDGTSLELVGVPDGEAAPTDLDAGGDHPWTGGQSDGAIPAERAIRGVRGVSVRSADPYVTASLLDTLGFDVSRVKDRHFFESLYVRDGGGILFELATERPGLGVAEREPDPGGDLVLPPWLEADRGMIEGQLPPFDEG